MTQAEFEKLQKTQMQIMDEVHRLCQKYGITYYMIGGTLLGAVRHSGFIPWDLDIDIAMPRESYDRFKTICSEHLDARFLYRDYTNTKSHRSPHALVCIRNTKLYLKHNLLNPKSENYGIYIDIFPLDNAPSSVEAQKKQAKQIRQIKMFKAYLINYRFSDSMAKTILRKVFRCLFFWISVDNVNALLDGQMRKYNGTDTGLLCSMASHYSYKKQCMPSEVYGTPQMLEFSGRMYYAPQQYSNYLERIYGDYMKLPPVEQQKANLDEIVSVVFDQ